MVEGKAESLKNKKAETSGQYAKQNRQGTGKNPALRPPLSVSLLWDDSDNHRASTGISSHRFRFGRL
jgi:hypothetical protein